MQIINSRRALPPFLAKGICSTPSCNIWRRGPPGRQSNLASARQQGGPVLCCLFLGLYIFFTFSFVSTTFNKVYDDDDDDDDDAVSVHVSDWRVWWVEWVPSRTWLAAYLICFWRDGSVDCMTAVQTGKQSNCVRQCLPSLSICLHSEHRNCNYTDTFTLCCRNAWCPLMVSVFLV